MKTFILSVFTFLSLTVSAQKDAVAKQLLDQIGAKVKASKGILVNITLTSKNNKGKTLGAKQIALQMKGDKYLLKEGKMEILCDGVNIYNFDGVNSISKSSVAESDQTLSPQKLLSGNYDK
ncbi:MAG: LolA family protein, partial [Sediminibacterium sp.]